MKPTIQITDNRTAQNFAKENMEVSISTPTPQTFQVLNDDGSIEEKTLNIIQPGQTTTLKDLDADLSNLQIELQQAQAQVDSLTQQISDKQALRDQVEAQVTDAFNALPTVQPDPAEPADPAQPMNPAMPVEKLA